MTNRKRAEWLVMVFFAALILLVFQQIMTDMTERGIASGGPYNNAASYPRAVAVIIGILLIVQLLLRFFSKDKRTGNMRNNEAISGISLSGLKRPVLLLVIFAAYLWALGFLGYYISTPFMMMGIIFLTGLRKPVQIVLSSFITTFILAFVFESFLKIVLPGGIFRLNMPW